MNLELEVEAKAKVHISEIAASFSQMNSDEQAVFLQEIFDALEFQCKDHFKYESQLLHITTSVKRYNFKRLKYVF